MANYSKKKGLGGKAVLAIVIAVLIIAAALVTVWGTGYAITGNPDPSQWQASVNTVINGKDGANGADGQTPHIGENGNWFIGEADTGVKAAGQDGAAGADGANGQDGQPGTKLYRHSINAQYTGKVGNNVSFIIYSSDAEPYTATTLPKGEIVSGMSYYNSEVPLTVHILENGKAEITILDLSSETPYLMHNTADTITDTVTEV